MKLQHACAAKGEQDKKKEADGGKGVRRQNAAKLPGQAEGLGTSDEATTSAARWGEPSETKGRGTSQLSMFMGDINSPVQTSRDLSLQ